MATSVIEVDRHAPLQQRIEKLSVAASRHRKALGPLDALAQVVFGTSPLFWGLDQLKQLVSGRPMCTAEQMAGIDRLSGFLGPCNRKLGVVMASLSPFLFAVQWHPEDTARDDPSQQGLFNSLISHAS